MSVIIRAAGATALAAISLAGATASASAAGSASAPAGRLVFVQALPAQSVNITIDGQSVDRDSSTGAVLGPFSVAPGKHRVEFTGSGDLRLVSTVDVAAGSSSDVVVHLPAQVGGSPVVNSYRTPMSPIAPGKARVLIAHTATVAPADVRVDGTVVFHDIANGEYATADIAAGAHTVSLLPAGLDHRPILGPLQLSLQPGTVTMVYAVGNPRNGSMNVILHRTSLSSNGAAAPVSIDTGSVGLVAGTPVRQFSVAPTSIHPSAATAHPRSHQTTTLLVLFLGCGAGLLVVRQRARRPSPRSH
jgi:Domain of unknown function (DUF4397)